MGINYNSYIQFILIKTGCQFQRLTGGAVVGLLTLRGFSDILLGGAEYRQRER